MLEGFFRFRGFHGNSNSCHNAAGSSVELNFNYDLQFIIQAALAVEDFVEEFDIEPYLHARQEYIINSL